VCYVVKDSNLLGCSAMSRGRKFTNVSEERVAVRGLLTVKTETLFYSETLVAIYQSTWCITPEGLILRSMSFWQTEICPFSYMYNSFSCIMQKNDCWHVMFLLLKPTHTIVSVLEPSAVMKVLGNFGFSPCIITVNHFY